MRRIILLVLSFTFVNITIGQFVTENVNFDIYTGPTNNDFANNFTGQIGMNQIITNGITGGSLTVPNINDNNNAKYCSRYKHFVGSTDTTSISFKCDTAQINPNTPFERAIAIILGGNHGVRAYVHLSEDSIGDISMSSYSATLFSAENFTLHDGKWYEFKLVTKVIGGAFGDQIDLTTLLYDLGLSGQSPPVLVNTTFGSIYDEFFAIDTAVDVSFYGSRWGGAIYLDNFSFSGNKSSVNCSQFCLLSFAQQPTDQIGVIGDTAQFFVGSSSSSINYQWQADLGSGFQNLDNSGQYSGVLTAALTVSNILLSNNNEKFRCILSSGPCSSTSNFGLLNVSDSANIPSSNVGINTLTPARNLHINDVLRLEPRNTAPTNAGKGDIYFDGLINKLRVYDGVIWRNCW
jgi:hypothetical protein